MPVSVKEVAERAGVSVGTVSNVLNRPESVKPATVERVNQVIDELGYVPNAAARQLRAGQSTSIALVVLDVANPFFTDVARGVESRASESGFSVLLANSDESVERESIYLDLFERQRVAGVLVSPIGDDLPHLLRLRSRGIPVVLVDRVSADDRFPSVSVDDVAGGRLAAQHLLDTGRRKLLFVGGPQKIRQVEDRLRGARKAVDQVPGAILEVVHTAALTLAEGRVAGEVARARVRAGQCDAVFAANDLLAIGMQQSMLGGPDAIRIPADVALVGYDDISFAAAAVVPVTSVRQPSGLIGATAVDLLLAEKDLGVDDRRQHIEFQPELVVRESSAARPESTRHGTATAQLTPDGT
ncbi:MAG: LacI family transcriptional regulator [Actinobacteria bacterium HGW-Actinobacteria-4]|nr:MAG: LacI family transcriptional regulator [Actinobacteria bacterium HGW-Actinobacteria-4]